jgi:uncharacterized protein YbjT (DUF2867 family)
MQQRPSIVMLGATGAVGNHAARTLAALPRVERLLLLGRRPATDVVGTCVSQEAIDISAPETYRSLLPGHETAICALGVGQPSKMSRDDFVRIDRDAVIDFASACKQAGVRHFELLGAVGASATSSSFYLRTKGELEDALKALGFARLSLFHPSMILTTTNRYGIGQAIALFATPLIGPLLIGTLRKFRGIPVDRLGNAMAMNVLEDKPGVETLHWDDFMHLSNPQAICDAAHCL